MKVYVVIWRNWDDSYIVGVYRTEKAAETARLADTTHHEVYEHELLEG